MDDKRRPVGFFDTHQDGTLRCSISPNMGEGTASMQQYIQEHMMSILQPIAGRVNQLEYDFNKFLRDQALKEAKIARHQERLDNHEDALTSLQNSVDDTTVIDQLRADLTNLEKRFRTDGEAAKDIEIKILVRLDAATANIETLGRALTDCDARIQDLQAQLPQVAKAASRAETGVADLKASHEGFCSHHQDLARSHQLTLLNMERCRATDEHHQSLLAQLQNQKIADAQAFQAVNARAENFEKALACVRHELGDLQIEKNALQNSVSECSHRLGFLQQDLSTIRESDNDEREQIDDVRADMRADAKTVAERLIKLEDNVASVVGDVAAMIARNMPRMIQELTHNLEKNTADVNKNSADIETLDAITKNHDISLQDIDQRTKDLDNREARLYKRTEDATSQILTLTRNQQKAAVSIDMQQIELERARENHQQMTNTLGQTKLELRNLSGEVGSTRTGIANMNMRLELAHEYIDGIGEGFRGTHQHVLSGSGGMLPPKGVQSRTLPALSHVGHSAGVSKAWPER